MILFYNDWFKYKTAKPDYDTKNESFLRVASIYKAIGVKNYAFMLALHDQSLKGIDCYSPYLTPHQILAITAECKINPWFFFREIAKAPGRAGDDPVPFIANRGNIALYWCFFNHITTFLIQIRQTGKSFSTDLLDAYLLNIRCKNTTINLLTKDEKLRIENLQRIKDIIDEFPYYLKQRSKKDLDNTEVINVGSLDNWYKSHLPQKSKKYALNTGRGMSSPIFRVDEAPFQPNIEISLPAALAAGIAMRDKARKMNEPYGTTLTTTAGKKDDPDGRYIYNKVMSAAPWSEKFVDCENLEELEILVRTTSRGQKERIFNTTSAGELSIHISMNHTQLGYTDEWLMKVLEETMVTGEEADRDLFNRWTSGSQSSPFSIEESELIRSSQKEPLHTELTRIGTFTVLLRWYLPEEHISKYMETRNTILSADTSDASGGDDISLVLTDVKSGMIIMTMNVNKINLLSFSEWVCDKWLIKYPKLTLIPERRSSAISLIDYLLLILPEKNIDPFKRIFNRIVNEPEAYKTAFEEIKLPLNRRSHDIYVKYKKVFGFATSGSGITSRSELYSSTLMSLVRLCGNMINDKIMIDQLLSLEIRNGIVDHPPGEHDDMVIAGVLGHWFLTKAKNLSYYGIPTIDILHDNRKLNNENNQKESLEIKQQQEYKNKIKSLLEKLEYESDEIIIMKIENELRYLNSKLNLEENEVVSLDQLISRIKEQKKQNNISSNYYDSFYSKYERHNNPFGNYSNVIEFRH